MEVVGPGQAAQYDEVPAGALFLGNRSGSPMICIKVATNKQPMCIVLFPDDVGRGPSLANVTDWFYGDLVFHLDRVQLLFHPDNIEFGDSANVGELILDANPYMKIQQGRGTGYVNLSNGVLENSAPGRNPLMICRRWSLHWDAPETVQLPQWSFPPKR